MPKNVVYQSKIVIIGGGLAGLECANTLKQAGMSDFILLEKNNSIVKSNSWKTFPYVVEKFHLQECVSTPIQTIHFRTCDISTSQIITDNSPSVPCVVLNSNKIHSKYSKILSENIKINTKVIEIHRNRINNETFEFVLKTNNGGEITCNIIVDASGANSITDQLLSSKNVFRQAAYYLCYAKRYTNCVTESIRHDAFFDFDTPSKACGCWCYPVDDQTVEIGVARFTHIFGITPILKQELDLQIEDYKKLTPFSKVFSNAREVSSGNPISGFCPLLPRTQIYSEGIYYAGDAKGAVPYSGYGIENALESGHCVAESLLTGKKYTYFITPPSQGLGILNLLWQLTPQQLRTLSTGISELSSTEVQKFFTGHTDLTFFLHSSRISQKRNLNLIRLLPNGMIWRILFNRAPISSDFNLWNKMNQ